ncbi:alternative ribosome rescue aminoacyl-tRNA hydrolase ArfB [Urbifossiella limnaea]|uniref:Peptidyl-tRNA hydrolase ArfB n=1 Tax=Urbifossiella limnaea TaxID=2528023 RepID=A0A517XUG3_9BACT|nr:alternative ribosome rescue aminoacyl-tRNA hydrolase ArfB [Urbifossiella limnaea]QDU21140.1 Peptidyl-tRNA hydrolase ArfB [Urbifossiella limnaea]
MIQVTESIAVPDEELDWSYARSGGPGGQNVNKVSSKAVLRWAAGRTVAQIPLTAWERMKARFPSRFTVDGDVVISSQEFRDQERNREACAVKLAHMIQVSLVEPVARKKAKVSKAAKRRRVEDKRRQSAKKQGRRAGGDE